MQRISPIPIGGWLILLGLNLIALFLWRAWRLYILYEHTFGTQNALDQPFSESENILSSGEMYFILTISLSFAVIAAMIKLVILFLAREKAFLIWFPPTILAAITVTTWKLGQTFIFVNDPTLFHIYIVFVGLNFALASSFWIPYLHNSERARNTFVR